MPTFPSAQFVSSPHTMLTKSLDEKRNLMEVYKWFLNRKKTNFLVL